MSAAPSLTKCERGQVEAIEAVFKPWGLRTEVGNDGRHKHVKVYGPERRGRCIGVWRVTIVCTPRDPDNAICYAGQTAKRVLRDINAKLGLGR